jgi:hypothetical protein
MADVLDCDICREHDANLIPQAIAQLDAARGRVRVRQVHRLTGGVPTRCRPPLPRATHLCASGHRGEAGW